MYPPGFTPPHAQTVPPPMIPLTRASPSNVQIPPPALYTQTTGPTPTGPTIYSNLGQRTCPSNPNPVETIYVPDLDDPKEQERLRGIQIEDQRKERELYERFEERLKIIEGRSMHAKVDANELSLVPDLVLPAKFRVPEFTKYDGSKCPNAHLTLFYRKMAGYTLNDKVLIYCFQEIWKVLL